jgi:hypothetical protein
MADHNFEDYRQQYRPDKIRVLFVAESRPIGGTFFYVGNSNLARYTKEAFLKAYGVTAMTMTEFLDGFKAAGCYLEDLCEEPVNQIKKHSQRRTEWKRGVKHLLKRLESASPLAIIPIHKGIERYVQQAVEEAGLASFLKPAIPFPSMGHHPRYVIELSRLIDELREASILPAHLSVEALQFPYDRNHATPTRSSRS